ncbi:hypothetical protein LCGC14_2511060 [marine sediment metagenome]|uniref:Uncharacterized protein n=1 Tax=marine sediment metagenome TaxID=412755 RepID=A0A0F9BM03_9ZZZZ
MDKELEIRTQYLIASSLSKHSKSAEYCQGFDDGAEWMTEYIKELLSCRQILQQQKSDAE